MLTQPRTPSYRLHKPSGQAVVTIDGRDHYLGLHGSAPSREAYDRLIGEWLAGGRKRCADVAAPSVAELIASFWKYAEAYYRKHGEPTSELGSIRESMRPLQRLYGATLGRDFGPRALEACQQAMIDEGLARSTVNARVGRIKRLFKWATRKELIPPSVYHGLQAVDGLRVGRSAARETAPVKPVPEPYIEATLPQLSRQVRAMLEIQLLTGCRPGEARLIRGCDIETGDRIWEYRPLRHKMEHRGIERVIYLGPRAQAVLKPFLSTDLGRFLFRPVDAEQERNQVRRASRKSSMTPSHRRRSAHTARRRRKRAPGDSYTKDAYIHAVQRACDRADAAAKKAKGLPLDSERLVPRWSPNQLRHNAATRFRKAYGLEVAQVILGHSSADVTQVYAERDHEKALKVMARIG